MTGIRFSGRAAGLKTLFIMPRALSTKLCRGRYLQNYAEGVIYKTEFEPRIAGLKRRVSELQVRHQAALEAAESERDLALVISRLEDFSAKVTAGLDNLYRTDMRDIIRTVVRRIEIDASRIEVIFRVPSTDGPPEPRSPIRMIGSWQHCTGVGRAHARMDQPKPSFGPRFRSSRHDPYHAQTLDQTKPLLMNLNFLDRLSGSGTTSFIKEHTAQK